MNFPKKPVKLSFNALKRCTLILAASGFLGISTQAQATFRDGAGTAEFQYLSTLIYARPAGLAGAYTSLAQGIDAIGTNPAGLSKADPGRTLSGTFRYHMLEVASGNVTYGFPGAGSRAYAFSAAYINDGRIAGVDENNSPTGLEHMPVSFNPSFTVGQKISDNIRLGATAKGVSEYLGDYEGSQLAIGWGVDAGLLYQPNVKNVGFGLALLNLGRKERGHSVDGRTGGLLPVSLNGGFFYSPLDVPKAKVAVDLQLPLQDVPMLSGGVEYAYTPALTLRMGSRIDMTEANYLFNKASAQDAGELDGGNALKFAGGFTFQTDGLALDYAVQYWYGLSFVHAMTVRYALL